MEGKRGRLRDHEFEALLVNRHQPTVSLRNGGSASWRFVDHRHLTEERAGRNRFEGPTPMLKVHLPCYHGVHHVSRRPLCEDGGARRVVLDVLGVFEELCKVHDGFSGVRAAPVEEFASMLARASMSVYAKTIIP